jgi:hypothetical protein
MASNMQYGTAYHPKEGYQFARTTLIDGNT